MADTINQTLEDIVTGITGPTTSTNAQLATLVSDITAPTTGTNAQLATLASGITGKEGTNDKLEAAKSAVDTVNYTLVEVKTHVEHLITNVARFESSFEQESERTFDKVDNISTVLSDAVERLTNCCMRVHEGIERMDRRLEAIASLPVEQSDRIQLERIQGVLHSILEELRTHQKGRSKSG